MRVSSYICPFDDLLSLIPRNSVSSTSGCGAGTFLQLVAEYRQPDALAGLETRPLLIDTASARLNRYVHKTSMRLDAYDGASPASVDHLL
jgi:hypothetical protein